MFITLVHDSGQDFKIDTVKASRHLILQNKDVITKYFYKLESNTVSLNALLEIIAKYGVLINE